MIDRDDQGGPSVWDVISGLFLIVFGALFLLIGGGCTTFWGYWLIGSLIAPPKYGGGANDPSGWAMLLISIAVLASAVQSIRLGLRKLGGRG